jgi:hypothetical protein
MFAIPSERHYKGAMWQVFKEFLLFLREEKKWWLIPLITIFILVGLFILFAESSALAPFLYPLF